MTSSYCFERAADLYEHKCSLYRKADEAFFRFYYAKARIHGKGIQKWSAEDQEKLFQLSERLDRALASIPNKP